MAVSVKTASLDRSYHSNTTYNHNRDVISIPALEEGMYAELEKGKHKKNTFFYAFFSNSFVKFAREKKQQDLARVKLLLCNNSKRLVEWIIKSSNDNIQDAYQISHHQAVSKASGLIKAFDTEECILIWQRPKDYNSWRELPPLKIMLEFKLIASESGKVIGKANSKFRAGVDPDAVCTADEPPIHKVVLNSEPATMILRKEKPK
ncbi:unnamed protein product [Acanthocheilonema viteae]|uniref:Uncharacterized protein n=1 Tax=Acanthocheilonema viteae TaxID=6277 RepID=A0A498SM87_ACAVI|nr:unnamed protein product [Acanthocheilonema viteae]